MNRKLLFITLLCINAHNYGAQQNDPPQIAPLNTDQVDFIRVQERVLIPIRFFLLPSLEDSQEGTDDKKSRFWITGVTGLTFTSIAILTKPEPDFVVATGILGGLTGILIEQARKKTPDEQLNERKRSARENLIKKGNALGNNYDELMILAFPYFINDNNDNPDGSDHMEYCFASKFTSPENPYPMLKAEKEIVRLIEVFREIQDGLMEARKTLGRIHVEELIKISLSKTHENIETHFKVPLIDNLNHLRLSSRACDKERIIEYHNAALEKLKRR